MEKNVETKQFIRGSFENAKKLMMGDQTYFGLMFKQRIEGPTNAGSSYDVETIEELYDLLMSQEWEETTHPEVMEGCRVFKTDLPGLEGIIDIDTLPDDIEIYAIDPKGTGIVCIGVGGVPKKEAKETYLIIGKEDITNEKGEKETLDMVYTFHPGEPIRPSQVETKDLPDGTKLSKEDARKYGFDKAKYLSEEMREAYELKSKVIEKLKESKTVVTHFGDDLDNKASVYALEKFAQECGILKEGEHLNVVRVPAGQVKEGMLNVDTGGHKGNRDDNDTIVIDGDPVNGVKSAAESLSKLGFYVPEQIVKLADVRSNKVSALDSRSGLALLRYLGGKEVFELAEEGLIEKTLTDEEIERFGLEEAHEKQQKVIDDAVEKINKYTVELKNGKKIVLAPEQILGGANIAYEMGIDYFVSATNHINKADRKTDGITFAITSNPKEKLPESVLEFGKELVEEHRIDENSSGVFVSPNSQMIVAGGFKNPNFKIENTSIEEMLNEIKERFGVEKEIEKDDINETISNTTLDDISKTYEEIAKDNKEQESEDKSQGDE